MTSTPVRTEAGQPQTLDISGVSVGDVNAEGGSVADRKCHQVRGGRCLVHEDVQTWLGDCHRAWRGGFKKVQEANVFAVHLGTY